MRIMDTVFTAGLIPGYRGDNGDLVAAAKRFAQSLDEAWKKEWPHAEIEIEVKDCNKRPEAPELCVQLDDGSYQDPFCDSYREPLWSVLEIQEKTWKQGFDRLWKEA